MTASTLLNNILIPLLYFQIIIEFSYALTTTNTEIYIKEDTNKVFQVQKEFSLNFFAAEYNNLFLYLTVGDIMGCRHLTIALLYVDLGT